MEPKDFPRNDVGDSPVQKDMATLFPDDRALVRAAVDGSEFAFETIVRKYGPVVRANLAGRVNSRHDQDDIFQEVFVSVFRNLPHLRKTDAMRSWIVKITRSRLQDYYRKQHQSRKTEADLLSHNRDKGRDTREGPEEAFLNLYEEDLAEIVLASIAKLKESQRTVVYLRLFESMGYADIAERLKIREGTARARCARGIEKLRKLLNINKL